MTSTISKKQILKSLLDKIYAVYKNIDNEYKHISKIVLQYQNEEENVDIKRLEYMHIRHLYYIKMLKESIDLVSYLYVNCAQCTEVYWDRGVDVVTAHISLAEYWYDHCNLEYIKKHHIDIELLYKTRLRMAIYRYNQISENKRFKS